MSDFEITTVGVSLIAASNAVPNSDLACLGLFISGLVIGLVGMLKVKVKGKPNA